MNKVLLLSVGNSFFKGALWGGYDLELPLNAAYVAAFLESRGLGVHVVDLQTLADPKAHLAALDLSPYGAAVINCTLANTFDAYAVALGVKARRPELPVAAMGVFTVLRETLLTQCPALDYVVVGEEEHTVHELCAALLAKADVGDILGLLLRTDSGVNGGVQANAPRPFEEDLDSLPFPARHKFPLDRYYPSPGKYARLPQFSMLSSRGCKWGCFFCSNLRGKQMRLRSPENMVAEIDELQERYGAREIAFVDDTFTADRDRALRFCELMARRQKPPMAFRIAARVDTVDFELLSRLKDVGLYSVGYGLESGSDRVLAFNKKGFTTARAREAVAMTRMLGLDIRGYFMVNLPGDTRESTEETVAYIRELELDLVNVQIAYPWPGTAMREFVRQNYEVVEDIWERWDLCDGDDISFLQPGLPRDYIQDTYKRIIREQYMNPLFVLKWLGHLKSWHDFKYSFLQAASLFKRTVLRLS
ncbi:MAG: hypothetical protein A2051_07425 [Desulfovibrionales bacterium GWA2_65_9]|nr:MAG: hypothetical protein A2051_07425 [Desulfovibrionales bacterium GWA2_65_9]